LAEEARQTHRFFFLSLEVIVSKNQSEQHNTFKISDNESVRVKMMCLGLVVDEQVNFQCSTSTTLKLPEVLPSI
jgi:hypothetical protein